MPIALLLAIVLALILLNGFFAMAEMAIVASTESRLAERARRGSTGAAQALRLMRQPGRFLSSVQTGITLVGVIASAFSGATIAARAGARLNAIAWIEPHGETVAFAAVVAAITFASVVLGELLPKRIALANPEAIATAVAAVKIGATDYLSKPADATDITNALLAGETELPPPPENPMSADRVRWEHIQRVYELCDRNVSETARRLNMHRRTLQRILAKRAPR